MKIMELKGKMTTAHPNKNFKFLADSFAIRNDELEYDNLEMTRDDVSFRPNGRTWIGAKIDEDYAMEQSLNEYLRNCYANTEFLYICPEIKDIKKRNTDTKLYQIKYGTVTGFTLIAKSKDYSYYRSDVEDYYYIINNSDNDIITDYEDFFISGLCDSVKDNALTFVNEKVFDLEQFIRDYDLTVKGVTA